jgi:nucleoside-diphosphate-sugar epimerase
MRVLVTGGAGFIGSHIVDGLIARGDAVTVLDNLSTGNKSNILKYLNDGGIGFVQGDIRIAKDLAVAVDGVDAVVHCAALPSVSRSVEDPVETNSVNIDGTLNLLLQAKDSGVRKFVFSSSSSVYGNTLNLPKLENMAPAPRSPYATQKLTGEFYCKNFFSLFGLETYCLRYFNVYGPRQNPNSEYAAVIPRFISSFLKDEPPMIHGNGKQTRDFTFVADVVAANLACLDHDDDKGLGETYNICGGHSVSIGELAETLGIILGKINISPVHGDSRPGDVKDSLGDWTKASKAIDWRPKVRLQEGLEKTCEYFRNNE